MRTLRRLARNSRLAARLKRRISQISVLKRLHDAIARDGFVQDVLNLGQLVLAGARAGADFPADLARRGDHHWNEQHQRPAQMAAETNYENDSDKESKELLKKLADHGTERKLHAIHVIDERGKNRSGGMLVKEARRAAQRGLVEVIPQVGDHPVACIAHQVSAEVVAHSLGDRGGNDRSRHHSPRIVHVQKMRNESVRRSKCHRLLGRPRMIGPSGVSGRSTWSKTGCKSRTRKVSSAPTIARRTTPVTHWNE